MRGSFTANKGVTCGDGAQKPQNSPRNDEVGLRRTPGRDWKTGEGWEACPDQRTNPAKSANTVVRVSLSSIIGTIGTHCNRACCHDFERLSDQWSAHATLLIWLSLPIRCERQAWLGWPVSCRGPERDVSGVRFSVSGLPVI